MLHVVDGQCISFYCVCKFGNVRGSFLSRIQLKDIFSTLRFTTRAGFAIIITKLHIRESETLAKKFEFTELVAL